MLISRRNKLCTCYAQHACKQCVGICTNSGWLYGHKAEVSPRDYFLERRVTDVQSDLQVDLLQGPTGDWGVIGAVFTVVKLNLASLRFQDGSSVIMC